MSNFDHLAPGLNAYAVSFGDELLDELREAYRTVVSQRLEAAWLQGGESRSGGIEHEDFSFFVTSYGTSPLLWVSCNNRYTHGAFHRFFESLEIIEEVKQLVDYDTRIVVYCGFFVIGNYADEETWHVDYQRGSNAFTLLTPLFEPDEAHGDLLYYDQNSEKRVHKYRVGEALLFGDDFYHSTQTYARTDKIRVLLSLTLGTDKLRYWPKLEKVIGSQSRFVILPCGDERGTCDHLDE